MNPLILYLLLLKATATTFSGLASLPIIRNDLVVQRRVLTDRQLNAAVAAGQTTPGPLGLYVVSVGYFVAGLPGALAGCAALMTPAFLIVPLLRRLGARADQPLIRSAVSSLTLAAAGLIVSAAIPIGRDALNNPLHAVLAIASFFFLVLAKRDTLWIILGCAAAGLLAHLA
jgi:chromate transporter